jgi:hypothetical protein
MSDQLKFAVVTIDGANVHGWPSFHSVFKDQLGFPAFYGANMNAWIDCMTCVDELDDGMTTIHAPKGGVLIIKLSNAKALKKRCPEIYDALIECTAFVNYRRLGVGTPPVLMLSFHD